MKRFLILQIAAVFLALPALGAQQPLAPPADREAKPSQTSAQQKKDTTVEKRRKAVTHLRLSSEVRLFRDKKKGTPILTNRPEKYRGNQKYIEIAIKYEPITVPNRYRPLTSADKYSASSVEHLVSHYARRYGLDENLVYAVIRAESNFNPYAVSRAGARGLMQLMPGTALDMGVRNVFNPAENIAGGTQYLAKMLNLFNNDHRLALAAYNSGPETVKKHGTVPPISETQNYVRLVQQYWTQYAKAGVKPAYHLAGLQPSASFLPTREDKYYTIRLKNGLTQPAEKVMEQDDLYLITFRGIVRPIHKDKVQEITKPKNA